MARKKKNPSVKPPPPPPQPTTAGTDAKDLAQAGPATVALPVIEEVDARPETSPYGSPSCTVPFARPLTLPLDVLKRSPKLHAAYEAALPELPAIPEDVGHVLVHFLHTGKLESLRPKATDALSKQIWEFKTSIQAYAAARSYDLPDLMGLAEAKINKHGEGLPLPALLEVARDAYPTLTDGDGWFLDYLRSRIRPHLKDPRSLLGSNLLDEISAILSPNRVLLRTVLELFCERITVRREPATSPITSPVASPGISDRVSPLPPASPKSFLDLRNRPIPREALPAARKQTPWPSPDATSEASWSKETTSERTLPETAPPQFEALPVPDRVRVPALMPDLGPVIVDVLPEPETADNVRAPVETQPEPAAASEIERNSEPETGAEIKPEMDAAVEPEFKVTVDPEANDEDTAGDSAPQRKRKDSGKGIELEPFPEERELATPAPVSEPEPELKPQPQVRPPVPREADSGFWETPEIESGKEAAPSVSELEPVIVPASASTAVQGAGHELESSVGAPQVPAIEIHDFSHGKPEREDEVPVELVPKPEPEPASSSPTGEPSEAPVVPALESEAPPETAQSEELEKEVEAQPETKKKTQEETVEPEAVAEPESGPGPETPKPIALPDVPQPAGPAQAQTAQPGLEPAPKPAGEPDVQNAIPHTAVQPAAGTGAGADAGTEAAKPHPQEIQGAQPAPLEQERPKAETEVCGGARQRSLRRRILSLRYPFLFGRGM